MKTSKHAKATGRDGPDERPDELTLTRTQRGRRLVDQHRCPRPQHRPRHGYRLTLARRELADQDARRRKRIESSSKARSARSAISRRARHRAGRVDRRVAARVRETGWPPPTGPGKSQILVHALHATTLHVTHRASRNVRVSDDQPPAVRAHHAEQRLEQRRLTRAIVTEQRHDLSAPHLHVGSRERLHMPKALRDAAAGHGDAEVLAIRGRHRSVHGSTARRNLPSAQFRVNRATRPCCKSRRWPAIRVWPPVLRLPTE